MKLIHSTFCVVSLFLSACTGALPPMDGGTDIGSTDGDAGATDAGTPDTFVPYDVGMFQRTIAESEATAARASCTFTRGAMPWQTLGREVPIGTEIPVKHWIVLMQENRSFDHYLGHLPNVNGTPATASNLDATNTPVSPFHLDTYCTDDTHHSWNSAHRQWNNGSNDGFVVDNEPNGRRSMGYYDSTDLPFYYGLYGTFAMSDAHFCSLLGPTWVNRDYFLAGTSFGLITNTSLPNDRVPTDGSDYLIFQQLDRANVSWKIYSAAVSFILGSFPQYAVRGTRGRSVAINQFYTDLDANALPQVSWIDPAWEGLRGIDGTDEHPHANVQRGQAFIREVITRVMASSSWQDTAIVLTYDEWGGFYDHVAPPAACKPDARSPDLTASSSPGEFDRLGFRVPMVIVSPWSRRNFVSHKVTDHTSVLRLLQTAYLLPALTARDANAWPLLDLLDFTQKTFATPPVLPAAPIDPAKVQLCATQFPP